MFRPYLAIIRCVFSKTYHTAQAIVLKLKVAILGRLSVVKINFEDSFILFVVCVVASVLCCMWFVCAVCLPVRVTNPNIESINDGTANWVRKSCSIQNIGVCVCVCAGPSSRVSIYASHAVGCWFAYIQYMLQSLHSTAVSTGKCVMLQLTHARVALMCRKACEYSIF
jgi:hypothetical protein